jgi:hypothetical protein
MNLRVPQNGGGGGITLLAENGWFLAKDSDPWNKYVSKYVSK